MKAKVDMGKTTDGETDLIRGGGDKVSIAENLTGSLGKGGDQSSLKQGTINDDSRKSSDSRARIAEKLKSKLPKAGTIQIGGPLAELTEWQIKQKIHVVKHFPKSDEEILDELIVKHTEQNTSIARAKKDAKTELN